MASRTLRRQTSAPSAASATKAISAPKNADLMSVSEWCSQNQDQLGKADELIGRKLADARNRGNCVRSDLVDELFNNIVLSNLKGSARGASAGGGADGASEDCNGSVLLLGESGSGKTHAVEHCVKSLQHGLQQVVVLRAYGGAYKTDVECIRHLASQVSGGDGAQRELPARNASFEQGMEWLRTVLREGFRDASAVVIILERFEHFCSKSRQTLLYNLFDIAQEAGVRLCIIGTSEKMDVMELLEKRIRSRFSMRFLPTFRPTKMGELVEILTEKLSLPSKCGLQAPFVAKYSKYLEAALKAKGKEWEPHLAAGRPPAWFLWRCLPVASLLRESGGGASTATRAGAAAASLAAAVAPSPPPSLKRRRLMSSCTRREAQRLLLDGLCEDEHVVLLALHRLRERQAISTLSAVLHEVQMLHEGGHFLLSFSDDRYNDAFDRLLQQRLVEIASPSSAADPPRRYMQCLSRVDWFYDQCIGELAGEKLTGVDRGENPLRDLPEAVQQWSLSQRTGKASASSATS